MITNEVQQIAQEAARRSPAVQALTESPNVSVTDIATDVASALDAAGLLATGICEYLDAEITRLEVQLTEFAERKKALHRAHRQGIMAELLRLEKQQAATLGRLMGFRELRGKVNRGELT